MSRSHLSKLTAAAKALEGIGPRIVFVGGSIVELYLTEPVREEIRPTLDVDCILDVWSRETYYNIENELRNRGFSQPGFEDDPICRWRRDEIVLDLVPPEVSILGFTNRWYAHALKKPIGVELLDGQQILIPKPAIFLATKLTAYKGRGEVDPLASHDLEDIVALIDGRPQFKGDIEHEGEDIQNFIKGGLKKCLNENQFLATLPGYFALQGPGRAKFFLDRMEKLTI